LIESFLVAEADASPVVTLQNNERPIEIKSRNGEKTPKTLPGFSRRSQHNSGGEVSFQNWKTSPHFGHEIRGAHARGAQHIAVRRQEVHNAMAETALEMGGAAGHALAKAAEVVLEAALSFSPLDRAPLQQMARAEFAFF
jgi:hypothetical protein